MEITLYKESYKQQIIDLVLHIQNEEAKINLSLEEQPDLLDIPQNYTANGGRFWVAADGNQVVGTVGLMKEGDTGILKKFFVHKDWRAKKVGLALYQSLLRFAEEQKLARIILDTPSVAEKSHRFYEHAGFRRITKEELPVPYHYPDRHSYLYMLTMK